MVLARSWCRTRSSRRRRVDRSARGLRSSGRSVACVPLVIPCLQGASGCAAQVRHSSSSRSCGVVGRVAAGCGSRSWLEVLSSDTRTADWGSLDGASGGRRASPRGAIDPHNGDVRASRVGPERAFRPSSSGLRTYVVVGRADGAPRPAAAPDNVPSPESSPDGSYGTPERDTPVNPLGFRRGFRYR